MLNPGSWQLLNEMLQSITISQFLFSNPAIPVLDVRTPAEFTHGHIPGALNLPLFSNEERVQVGTTYKQQGKEVAILLGFDLTGAKWSQFIRDALVMAPGKKVAVHCWRGGMRSAGVAWLLDLYGFKVYTLVGGYKKYRQWARSQFEKNYNLKMLGGYTGSGKSWDGCSRGCVQACRPLLARPSDYRHPQKADSPRIRLCNRHRRRTRSRSCSSARFASRNWSYGGDVCEYFRSAKPVHGARGIYSTRWPYCPDRG